MLSALGGDPHDHPLGGHHVPELLEPLLGDQVLIRPIFPVLLGPIEGVLRRVQLAAQDRGLLQIRPLAVAHLAGAEPVRHGHELDLGDEVGHLDERGAFPLAGLDALIAADGIGQSSVEQERDVGQQSTVATPAGLEPRVEDPAERALAGAEADHGGVQADGRLILGGAAVGRESRDRPEGTGRARADQVERRLRPSAGGVGDVLLGDDRLDGIDAQGPFGVHVMLERGHRLVGDLGLEEAEVPQVLPLDGGVLVDHVLLEAAVDAGGLDPQGEREEVHDVGTPAGPLGLRRGRPGRGLLDRGVLADDDLHPGDPGEIPPGDLLAELLERVAIRGELIGPVGGRGLLEEMIRGLQLVLEPARDASGAMMGLGPEVRGELVLGLLAEPLDAGLPVEELGVGERDQRECRGAQRRRLVAGFRLAVVDRLGQVVDRFVDHDVPQARCAACAWT